MSDIKMAIRIATVIGCTIAFLFGLDACSFPLMPIFLEGIGELTLTIGFGAILAWGIWTKR